MTEFAPQFESQGSHLCWENICLPVRAEISNLSCGSNLKVFSTVGILSNWNRQFESQENRLCWENMCLSIRAEIYNLSYGSDLKVFLIIEILLKIPRGLKKKKKCQALQEARLVQNAFQVIYLLLGVFVLRTAFNNSEKRFTLNLTVKHIIKTWQLQKKVLFDVVKLW